MHQPLAESITETAIEAARLGKRLALACPVMTRHTTPIQAVD